MGMVDVNGVGVSLLLWLLLLINSVVDVDWV